MPRRNRNPKQRGTHKLDGWTSWAREIGERKGSPQPPIKDNAKVVEA